MLRTALTVVTLIGVGWIIYRLESLMADINDLGAAMDRNDTAQSEALARVAEDVAELRRKVDEGAQAADLTPIVERLEASTARLQGVDPDPSFPAAPETPAV